MNAGDSSSGRREDPFESVSRVDPATELVFAVQRLAMARNLIEIQEVVRSAARRLTGSDGATFVLRDGEQCYYADEDAISPLWKGQRFPLESCISGWAMLNREPAVIEDIYADDRIPHEAYRPTFVKSLAMVPIRTRDPIGAIGNYWARPHRPTAREVELLQALADSTAVSMESVNVYEQLADERLDALRRLARVAEYRDDATHEHTERVGHVSRLLAGELGLPPVEAALLRQAAPLHDIGKLAVPDAILLKPGKLDASEFDQIKAHTIAGADILSGSRSETLRLAEQIALTHHEWWDGSGYPSGLAGDSIPISGRIVALADVFDALSHPRPYKDAWPVGKAVAEIERLAGTQFDPEVIAGFHNLDPEELLRTPGAQPGAASAAP
ncbi:MAG TPA: HD domain-containing phosphohydrolase [Solirubrobacterales bacterium]|nr:HD domain-containing phosphohydrolase [Solirubrobacterales bacterium]